VRQQEVARLALASIRTVNGLAALFTPRTMLRRLGVDPEGDGAAGAAIYVLRMFGIRTILLGVELFAARGQRREELLRTGLVIHASDATSAFTAGVTRALPRKVAMLVTLISCVNTYLAFVARRQDDIGELTGAERG
jgi:hypothetical protein